MDGTCQAMAAQGHSRSAYTIGSYFAVALAAFFLWVFGHRRVMRCLHEIFSMVEVTQAHDQFLLILADL